jgi:hypothetical protein
MYEIGDDPHGEYGHIDRLLRVEVVVTKYFCDNCHHEDIFHYEHTGGNVWASRCQFPNCICKGIAFLRETDKKYVH